MPFKNGMKLATTREKKNDAPSLEMMFPKTIY